MFLHTFIPGRILISFGPISIYWYGFFIVIGILLAINIALKLADYYKIQKDTVIDLSFWLIFAGVIGARAYEIFLEWDYFRDNLLNIFKVWQGGLAIHGAIIGGVLALWLYVKKHNLNLWQMASIVVPGLALAQAVGRWGNYFNQELFGMPTDFPWGIPIVPANRVMDYYNYQYFHPTFLYESIGSVLIFMLLVYLHYRLIKKGKGNAKAIFLAYLICYSILRFLNEFLRIDTTLIYFGMRLPQLVSILIIIGCVGYYIYDRKAKNVSETSGQEGLEKF